MRKTSLFIAMIIVTVSGNAIAEERVVEPTEFESLVARASVVLEIDESVGSIASSDAKLEVALLVAGSARSSRRRNLRARLRADPANGNARQGRLYLNEARVAATIIELIGIEAGIADLKSGTTAPFRVQGAANCSRHCVSDVNPPFE